MKRESKYASCLNALDEMQQSVIYAARKGFLAEAESIIVRLESETAEQRQIIDEQVEENRGLRADVGVLQTADAEQRQEIARLKAELSTWRAKVEKLINLKGHIERELRGYGTPEEEIAKKAAWMKGKT